MNIFMLHCALVMRIFRIEGIKIIINAVLFFGHAFEPHSTTGVILIFLYDLNNFLTSAY